MFTTELEVDRFDLRYVVTINIFLHMFFMITYEDHVVLRPMSLTWLAISTMSIGHDYTYIKCWDLLTHLIKSPT